MNLEMLLKDILFKNKTFFHAMIDMYKQKVWSITEHSYNVINVA